MPALARVFALKILVTLLCWSLPLLLLPATVFEALGVASRQDAIFLRLLGWAWLALCVGYGFGLQAARARQAAPGPVWTGIVSNGGAGLLLLGHGLTGAWAAWHPLLRAGAWASVGITLALAGALWHYGARRRQVDGASG